MCKTTYNGDSTPFPTLFRLWTGTIKAFTGLVRIDGTAYRFMGPAVKPNNNPPPMSQLSVQVFPMRTVYTFAAGGVKLTLEFTSPLFIDDFELNSRPITTLSYIFESRTPLFPHPFPFVILHSRLSKVTRFNTDVHAHAHTYPQSLFL
jgi:hypothetical protein